MSDNNVRWEPIRGNERLAAVGRIADMLPTGYALCRAVPVTWRQEPPTAEGAYWVWRPGYKVPDLWRFAEYADGMGMRDYWEVRRNGVRMSMPKSGMGNAGWWYMPAVVPQPPTGEVGNA